MSTYTNLLLSHGGGIIPSTQRTAQIENTVNIYIGIGGTGIDAIRKIKTEVYAKIEPDNVDEADPRYKHIRFLGIDSDEHSIGFREYAREVHCNIKSLNETEFFSIANPHILPILLKTRSEFSWFRWEDIHLHPCSSGARAIRQVGRLLLMDRSAQFVNRFQDIVNEATDDMSFPTINVHIFSGLSGGTGSGCFLDVCYLVRSVVEQIDNIKILGYFFLPDVNLSRFPMADTNAHRYLDMNGYAAIQELDYCMQLQHNGGRFIQDYPGGMRVEWNQPPVDMCHLIGAANTSWTLLANAYQHAIDITATNIIHFLTCPHLLDARCANFNATVRQKDRTKRAGMNLSYCSLGAAEAYVPMREMFTYLASELFEKFSHFGNTVPSKADVDALVSSALAKDAQSISDIYNSFWREMCNGFNDSYSTYDDGWQFVRDYGDRQMIASYTNQTAAKLNIAEKNAKSMTSAGNQRSLVSRVESQLQNLIRNINYGPMFAYDLISAAKSNNLLNIIDELIQMNTFEWDLAFAQTTIRQEDYENAKSDFENRRKRYFFDNDVKQFGDYEYYLMLLEQHKLNMHCHQKMDEVLREFRKQLVNMSESYYKKLSRVTETLANTFEDNRKYLENLPLHVTNTCSIPLLNITDIQDVLDRKIDGINISEVFAQMMTQFMDHEEEWIDENSAKITTFITGFFVTVFDFPGDQSITQLLRYKYGQVDDTTLANYIYHDFLVHLEHLADPLFDMDGVIWQKTQSAMECVLGIPNTSAPIRTAAILLHNENNLWEIVGNMATDRITALCWMAAFPLCTNHWLRTWEQRHFGHHTVGTHIYEGKLVRDLQFSDWRMLPPITPQGLLNLGQASEAMKAFIAPAQELFDKAAYCGIINLDGRIFAPSEDGLTTLMSLIDMAYNAKEETTLQSMIEQIKSAMNIPLVYTGSSLRKDGYEYSKDIRMSILKDYFIAAPVLQMVVQRILSRISSVESAAVSTIAALEERLFPN